MLQYYYGTGFLFSLPELPALYKSKEYGRNGKQEYSLLILTSDTASKFTRDETTSISLPRQSAQIRFNKDSNKTEIGDMYKRNVAIQGRIRFERQLHYPGPAKLYVDDQASMYIARLCQLHQSKFGFIHIR